MKNTLAGAGRPVILFFILSLSALLLQAQNMNMTGGGITIGAGATLNILGSVTVGNTSTVTNNNTILLSGDWTNNGGTYTGAAGTVSFKGAAAQAINGTSASTFNNVIINQSPAAMVNMSKDVTLAALTFTNGKLSIGSNTLSIGGAITNTAAGGLTGSSNSNVTIAAGNAAGTLSLDQTTPGTTNILKTLTLNSSSSATIGNSLSIAAGTTTVPGTLNLASGSTLTTNDLLTLKSNASGTSRVAEIPVNGSGAALATINGKVTVERWVSSRRAWRLICVPLQNTGAAETSIWNAWQEGTNNTVDLTTGGSYATDNIDPNPGFGTHVTCDKGLYNSTTDGFDAASKFYASLLSHNGTDWGGRPANTKNTYVTSKPGWMLFVRGSRAVNLSLGTSSASDVTVLRPKGLLLTGRQTTTTVTNPSGYNLINNPFASSIDLTKCTLDGNPISTIGYYLWDPYILGVFSTVGGYTYYDPSLGFLTTPVSPIANNRIEAGSAFFVPSVSGQTLIIPEASKLANNSQVLRPAGILSGYMKMKTSLYIDNAGQSAQADACGQVMNDGFSNEFLQQEDRLKMNNFSENMSILNSNKKLIVEYRKPYTSDDTVFYYLSRMGVKNYHFSFEPGNMGSTNLTGTLEDNYTGNRTDISLTQNTIVPFTVTADTLSSASSRFRLVFKQSNPLPLTFGSIKAYLRNNPSAGQANDIMVQWQVHNELNIREYEVEKSTDGRNFVTINTTAARGNGSANQLYNTLDIHAVNGNNFYRIRSIGAGGEEILSQVVKINIGKSASGISVFPNPVTNNTIYLQMNDVQAGLYNATLTNSSGQLILNRQIVQTANFATNTIIPSTDLLPGIYQLKITGPDKKVTIITLEVQRKL